MTTNPPLHDQNLPSLSPYYEDEINLVDLWLVLVRRRSVMITVAALVVMAGLFYALLVSPSYQYTTSIEIGSRISGDTHMLVESPETLLAKMQEGYVPLARQEYLAKHPERDSVPKIDSRIPKSSQIIVLESKGPESETEMHKTVQQAVVDMVLRDHSRIVDVLRKETEILQNKAKTKLEEIKDASTLIRAREKRLTDVTVLLTTQTAEVRADLQRAMANREQAGKQVATESKAMMLLMLDSEIQQHRQHLATLEERLQVVIADQRDALAKALADNRRAQLNQRDTIAKLEIQLANLRETRALLPLMRSPEPSGPGAGLIVVLSLIVGLLLGVLATFFAEFLAKARSQAIDRKS
jgi:uncharacterized protein involved in exopolysaccharide biosynthesis